MRRILNNASQETLYEEDVWDSTVADSPGIYRGNNTYDVYRVSQLRYILDNADKFDSSYTFNQRTNFNINNYSWRFANISHYFTYNGNGYSIKSSYVVFGLNYGIIRDLDVNNRLCSRNMGLVEKCNFSACAEYNTSTGIIQDCISDKSNPNMLYSIVLENNGIIKRCVAMGSRRVPFNGMSTDNTGTITECINFIDGCVFGISDGLVTSCMNFGKPYSTGSGIGQGVNINCVNAGIIDEKSYAFGGEATNCSNIGDLYGNITKDSVRCTNCTNSGNYYRTDKPVFRNNDINCFSITDSNMTIDTIPVSTAVYNVFSKSVVLYPVGGNSSNVSVAYNSETGTYIVENLLGGYSVEIVKEA